MRATIGLVMLAVLGGCQPAGEANNQSANVAATIEAQPHKVTLKAADGVTVHGRYYEADSPKALILLFHQAGSSKDEYATIAPRLVEAGYSALAIDQRSGGGLYGPNETVAGDGAAMEMPEGESYLAAEKDLEAALAWAEQRKLPIVLWGSSYSSSLIFRVAAARPGTVKALLAFSPGEYFDDKTLIRKAAAKVTVPVFVTSTADKDEVENGDLVFNALPKNDTSERIVPRRSVHGSSMLVESKNPDGAADIWQAVLAFLGKVAP